MEPPIPRPASLPIGPIPPLRSPYPPLPPRSSRPSRLPSAPRTAHHPSETSVPPRRANLQLSPRAAPVKYMRRMSRLPGHLRATVGPTGAPLERTPSTSTPCPLSRVTVTVHLCADAPAASPPRLAAPPSPEAPPHASIHPSPHHHIHPAPPWLPLGRPVSASFSESDAQDNGAQLRPPDREGQRYGAAATYAAAPVASLSRTLQSRGEWWALPVRVTECANADPALGEISMVCASLLAEAVSEMKATGAQDAVQQLIASLHPHPPILALFAVALADRALVRIAADRCSHVQRRQVTRLLAHSHTHLVGTSPRLQLWFEATQEPSPRSKEGRRAPASRPKGGAAEWGHFFVPHETACLAPRHACLVSPRGSHSARGSHSPRCESMPFLKLDHPPQGCMPAAAHSRNSSQNRRGSGRTCGGSASR